MKDTSVFGKLTEVCISNIGRSVPVLYEQCPALRPYFEHLKSKWVEHGLDEILCIHRFVGDNNGPVDFLLVDQKKLNLKTNITPWASSKVAPNASDVFKPQCSYKWFWNHYMRRTEPFVYDLHKRDIMTHLFNNCGQIVLELIKLFFAHDHLVYLQAYEGKLLITYPNPMVTKRDVNLVNGGHFFVHLGRGQTTQSILDQSSMTIKYRKPDGNVLSIANFQVHNQKAGNSDSHQINTRLMVKAIFDMVDARLLTNINCHTIDLGRKIVVKANKDLSTNDVTDMFSHMSIASH